MEDWYSEGVCRGVDPAIFYPENDNTKTTKNAISICKTCPVRMECLVHAIQNNECFGVWGGMSARSRMKLMRMVGPNTSHANINKFINDKSIRGL